jgi:hypothetical protein
VGVVVVARLVRELLYTVSPYDPLTLGATVAVLLACALVALLSPCGASPASTPISALR